MNAVRFAVLGALLCMVVFPLWAEETGSASPIASSTPKTEETKEADESKDTGEVSLAEAVASLDLRQKVCQLMMVNLEGKLAPTPNDRALVGRYTPGAVVLTGLTKPSHATAYLTELHALSTGTQTGIPLLIGTDLLSLPLSITGNKKDSFVPFPSWLAVAAANSTDATQHVTGLLVDHLTGMGFNMHMGPSLALAPVLPEARGSVACLGSDPATVSEIASHVLGALSDAAVLAVPTDFPGGAWDLIGKEPAILLTPRAHMTDNELLPFARAIQDGARAIHVGTMLVPTLDSESRPACLSSAVMNGLLRKELGFEGVIIAGPMDSQTTAARQTPIEAAILALNAGADMIYWTNSNPRVMKAVESIVLAVGRGRIKHETIDRAVERVVRMKDELGLLQQEMPSAAKAKKLEKTKDYAKTAYQVERASITVVQNRGNVLPLGGSGSLPVGVTGAVGVEDLHDALEKYMKPVGQQPIGTARHGNDIYDFEIDRIVTHSKGLGTAVCIFPSTLKAAGVRELIRKLKGAGPRVVVVVLGYPSTLSFFAEADAIVLAYADPMACSESMRAVADVLAGQAPLAFLPGITDLTLPAGKTETFSILDIVRTPSGTLPATIDPPFVAGYAVSTNPAPAIKKVLWDFGDGVKAKELRPEHTYEQPGTYALTVTVTDTKGDALSRTYQVAVE